MPAHALKNLPSSAGHEPRVARGPDAESQCGGTSCGAPIHRVSSHCQRARRRSLRPRHAGGKANNRATAKIYVNLWATKDDKPAILPMPLRRESLKTLSHVSTLNMLAVPVARLSPPEPRRHPEQTREKTSYLFNSLLMQRHYGTKVLINQRAILEISCIVRLQRRHLCQFPQDWNEEIAQCSLNGSLRISCVV